MFQVRFISIQYQIHLLWYYAS